MKAGLLTRTTISARHVQPRTLQSTWPAIRLCFRSPCGEPCRCAFDAIALHPIQLTFSELKLEIVSQPSDSSDYEDRTVRDLTAAHLVYLVCLNGT